MAATQPYLILDDNEGDPIYGEGFTIDLVDFEPEAGSPRAADSPPESDLEDAASIKLPEVFIDSYSLDDNKVIKLGDTVELLDLTRSFRKMQSGDFFRIQAIIKNLETDVVYLRGFRMLRIKYLGPLFDWRFNELAMVLRINEGDQRPLLVAGLEDIEIKDDLCNIWRRRQCVFTHKPCPPPGCGDPIMIKVPRNLTQQEIKLLLFEDGVLTCRSIYVQYINARNQKPYSGIVRHLYAREVNELKSSTDELPPFFPEVSNASQLDDDDDDCVVVLKHSIRGRRESLLDVEILEAPPRRIKEGPLTFADGFCGAGGASQGAVQAGFLVRWGFDKDDLAIEAYELNHPGALAFKMDAHDFPPCNIGKAFLRVDVLHLSPPCCYWSPAHTHNGRNDQANYEAIFTIEEILKQVKPRVVTLEQTFGLMTHSQHRKNFLKLLNDIGRAGYNLRYKMQDLSELGLAQKRKRLIIIAARRGTPLPPFPKATRGPQGSNLKPFTTIADALQPLTRIGSQAFNDVYHQPRPFRTPRPRYSSHTQLRGCITTGGTTSCHPSGLRNFTVRELSFLQGFPRMYYFTGTKTEASKQVGNAFPPIVAEQIYRTIAKTLEAFDEGVIGAEDDLDNLDELINRHDEIVEISDDDGIVEISDDE
ncbi:c-5 cytosine methyltransferase [Curvularia clavata]|uniref:DNA (cytosine-5-)-methyltransferase n=1 Tax=Curvularia clavata TaxID=95742 RepID=A0A9Q9DX86_CURCL|nr:c-5 cytosine methyltransferase [Curvularia clavata]